MAARAKNRTKIKIKANSSGYFWLSLKQKKLKIGPLLDFYGFLSPKKAKSKNGPIFTFNTAIESYEYTDFKNVENFEKK